MTADKLTESVIEDIRSTKGQLGGIYTRLGELVTASQVLATRMDYLVTETTMYTAIEKEVDKKLAIHDAICKNSNTNKKNSSTNIKRPSQAPLIDWKRVAKIGAFIGAGIASYLAGTL